jgi:hypothetical protein
MYPFVGFVRPGEVWIPGTMPTEVPSQVGDAAHFLQTRMLGDGKLNTMHLVQVGDACFPAVLTNQWPNGCFEVTAFKPNEQGLVVPMEFPTVHKSSIFLAATGENIYAPEGVVSLEVSAANPQSAAVFVDGESFLECFGRVSPKPSDQPQRIVVDVPKPYRPATATDQAKRLLQQEVQGIIQQEQPCQINIGPTIWEHFLSGEVRRGESGATRLERTWTVQLGPFARHTVCLKKKNHVNSVMTLYVDGEVLLECTSADIGGSPDVWRGKFSFVGERLMDFNIYEETKDGWPLDNQTTVTQPIQYRHVVEVAYQHRAIDNLVDAALSIDGVPFSQLPSMVDIHYREQALSITPSALKVQFGLDIPKKVAPEDSRGVARQLVNKAVTDAGGWSAIGQAASDQVQAIGNNLGKLGLSAWETVFLQAALSAKSQPAKAIEAEPWDVDTSPTHRNAAYPSGPLRAEPVQTMAPRVIQNGHSTRLMI